MLEKRLKNGHNIHGEIMNTNVILNSDGIKINKSNGGYIAISPSSGLISKDNDKINFQLQNDLLKVNKVEVEKEIKIPPLRLVVNKQNRKGWAIYSCKEV